MSKSRKAKKRQRDSRAPIMITHTADANGLALCGEREPFPSSAHQMASGWGGVDQMDACLTCSKALALGSRQ